MTGTQKCREKDYKPSNCKTITKVEDRKKTLNEKSLCFNCTWVKHRAAVCYRKKPVKHYYKVKIIHHFVNGQIQ